MALEGAQDGVWDRADAHLEGSAVLYEVRLGPYPSIEAAREISGVIRETFGLAPTLVVETESE